MNFKHAILAACAVLVLPAAAAADTGYPKREINYIIPYPPGGGSDITGRIIADALSQKLGVNVVVHNKGGAGGAIGTASATKEAADGYTLLHTTLGILAINPHVSEVQYDPLKDFSPVAMLLGSTPALVVPASFAPNTVGELIDYAKSNPGKVFYGTPGNGTITHTMGVHLNETTEMGMVHVPYQGIAAAMNDLLAGRIQVLFDSQPTERVAGGQVKALAAMGPERLAGLPQVPSITEAGVEKWGMGPAWYGVLALNGTPPEIVEKLSSVLVEIASDPAFAEKVRPFDVAPVIRDHKGFAEQIRHDHEFYGDLLKRAGVARQ